MSTTSLKIPQQLKERAATLAKNKGMSTHAFLISAIKEITETEEARIRVVKAAKKALAKARNTGTGFDATQVHQYIRGRAKGDKKQRPKEVAVWQD